MPGTIEDMKKLLQSWEEAKEFCQRRLDHTSNREQVIERQADIQRLGYCITELRQALGM